MKHSGIRRTTGSRHTKLSNSKVFIFGPSKSSSQPRLLESEILENFARLPP